jgi:hypothetical protein
MKTFRLLSVVLFVATSGTAHAGLTVAGYDPGLFLQCLKSPFFGSPNYYNSSAGCVGSTSRTYVNTARNSAGAVCAGIAEQSTVVGTGSTPTALNVAWANVGSAKRVDLNTNLITRSSPCTGRTYLYSAIVDEAATSAALPTPNFLVQAGTYVLNQTDSTAAKVRAGVVFQGTWDGQTHTVEIDLFQSSDWPDSHPQADIVKRTVTNGNVYIQMKGYEMIPLRYYLNLNEETIVNVFWNIVIEKLIDQQLLPMPSRAWMIGAVSKRVGTYTEIDTNGLSQAATVNIAITDLKVFLNTPDPIGNERTGQYQTILSD